MYEPCAKCVSHSLSENHDNHAYKCIYIYISVMLYFYIERRSKEISEIENSRNSSLV